MPSDLPSLKKKRCIGYMVVLNSVSLKKRWDGLGWNA